GPRSSRGARRVRRVGCPRAACQESATALYLEPPARPEPERRGVLGDDGGPIDRVARAERGAVVGGHVVTAAFEVGAGARDGCGSLARAGGQRGAVGSVDGRLGVDAERDGLDGRALAGIAVAAAVRVVEGGDPVAGGDGQLPALP